MEKKERETGREREREQRTEHKDDRFGLPLEVAVVYCERVLAGEAAAACEYSMVELSLLCEAHVCCFLYDATGCCIFR